MYFALCKRLKYLVIISLYSDWLLFAYNSVEILETFLPRLDNYRFNVPLSYA